MISIIDYGLGNIGAFLNLYKRLNIPARAVSSAVELNDSTKFILPGVGNFDRAMDALDKSRMRLQLEKRVLEHRVPILGVCVGMQMLAEGSEEGDREGLGWIKGHVKSFGMSALPKNYPLPHMGWNDVRPSLNAPLFENFRNDIKFYFLHSFYFSCANLNDVAATSNYGIDFASAVATDTVFGVQFHPEKSHHWGATLLKNFAEFRPC